MKARLLMLSAAGLVLAVAAHAAPMHDRFVEGTKAQAYARLADRGVDLGGRSISVRLAFGAERLASVGLARSSGSPDLDTQTIAALRNLKTERAPTELVGRTLVLTLGEPTAQAAPSPQ